MEATGYFSNERYDIKLISDGTSFDIRLTEMFMEHLNVIVFECDSEEAQLLKAGMLKALCDIQARRGK